MPRCCGGPPLARHRAVLDGLSAAGVQLPAGAQVWGPSPDGWTWRIVDEHGHEPDPPIRSTVSLRWLGTSIEDAVRNHTGKKNPPHP